METSLMDCSCCGRKYPKYYAKVLEAFESKQLITQYELSKKLGVSYRQILRIFHHLEVLLYIERDHTAPSAKGGKDKIFWKRTGDYVR